MLQFDHRLDTGFRAGLGLQTDLEPLVAWQNTLIFYETNLTILFNEPASAFVDIFRVGVLFGF